MNNNKSNKHIHTYISDSPISDSSDDLLGRSKFAEYFATSLLNYNSNDSLVFGLYGAWGEGKSSLINLVTNKIKDSTKNKKKTKPIIINFNPWLISSRRNLIKLYLQELARAIKYEDESDQAKKIGKELLAYSRYFALIGLIPLSMLFPSLPLPAIIVAALEKTLYFFGKFLDSYGELKKKGVEEFKKQLDKNILKLGRKIIVFVDDIDRLTSKEIRQMFQMIKLAANFPNTIYVLSFDRKMVADSLEPLQCGGEYLEKIIQIPFTLPKPAQSALEKVLFSGLDEILKTFDEKDWDQTRWSDFYNEAFIKKFKNLRKIKRFLNSLGFAATLIHEEVNPLDLMAIEFLKVFYPEVYEHVRDNKSLFVNDFRDIRDRDREQYKPVFDTIINNAKTDSDKNIVRYILIELFPKVKGVYTNTGFSSDLYAEWLARKMICSREKFDYYFAFAIQEGDVSRSELGYLASKKITTKQIEEKLSELKDTSRLSSFFARMAEFIEIFPESKVKEFLLALWKIGENLTFDDLEMPFMSDGDRAVTLSFQLLKKLKENERLKTMLEVLNRTDNVVTPTHLISITSPKEEENNQNQLFPDGSHEKLKKTMVNKLNTSAKNGNLISAQRLVYLLYRWEEWSSIKEPIKFVRKALRNKNNSKLLLEAFTQKVVSSKVNENGSRVSWNVASKELEHFVGGKRPILKALKLFNKIDQKSEKIALYFKEYLKQNNHL